MTSNGPKWIVLDFNQNSVINIGWNLLQMMVNIVFFHPVPATYLGKLQNGAFGAKIG